MALAKKHHTRRRRRSGVRGLGSVKSNFNQATSMHAFHLILQGIAGTIPYLFIPTLFGMNGPLAMATGTAATWITGVLLGWEGMQVAAGILPAMQIWYGYLQEPVVKPIFGRYFWRLNPGAPVAGTNQIPATDNTSVAGLRNRMGAGMSYYPGEMADAVMPGGAPAPGYSQALAGYGNDNPTTNFAALIANRQIGMPGYGNAGASRLAGHR